MKRYYVYIMASLSRRLYAGITNDLKRRVQEHKSKKVRSFTQRYNITRLVYFVETDDVFEAILFEKRIKGWRRQKKINLIEKDNSGWLDLSENWYPDES